MVLSPYEAVSGEGGEVETGAISATRHGRAKIGLKSTSHQESGQYYSPRVVINKCSYFS